MTVCVLLPFDGLGALGVVLCAAAVGDVLAMAGAMFNVVGFLGHTTGCRFVVPTARHHKVSV